MGDYQRDRRTADEPAAPVSLNCAAIGCPNPWSVEAGGGRLCSAHAWIDRRDWPRATEAQNDAAIERARRRPEPSRPAAPLTREQKSAILRGLLVTVATLGRPSDPKAWARSLRQREESGERLTKAQRDAWRDALGPDVQLPYPTDAPLPGPLVALPGVLPSPAASVSEAGPVDDDLLLDDVPEFADAEAEYAAQGGAL